MISPLYETWHMWVGTDQIYWPRFGENFSLPTQTVLILTVCEAPVMMMQESRQWGETTVYLSRTWSLSVFIKSSLTEIYLELLNMSRTPSPISSWIEWICLFLSSRRWAYVSPFSEFSVRILGYFFLSLDICMIRQGSPMRTIIVHSMVSFSTFHNSHVLSPGPWISLCRVWQRQEMLMKTSLLMLS